MLLGAIIKVVISDLLINLSRRQTLLAVLAAGIFILVVLIRIQIFEDFRKVLEALQLLVDKVMVIFIFGSRDLIIHEIEKAVIEVGDYRLSFLLDILSYTFRFKIFCSII